MNKVISWQVTTYCNTGSKSILNACCPDF